MNTVKGAVHAVLTQTGKGKNGDWTKKTVVVQTASKYNNLVPIEFFNSEANCSQGDEVEVEFFVGGREYQGKYYPQLDGNKVTVIGNPSVPTHQEAAAQMAAVEDEQDDLPF